MRWVLEVNSGEGVVSSSGFGGDVSLQLTAHSQEQEEISVSSAQRARPSQLRSEWAGMSKDWAGKDRRTQLRPAAPGPSQNGESEKEE